LKKQSKFWNTFYRLAVGGLILYVLFRFIKMKKSAVPKPKAEIKPGYLDPAKNVLSFDEIFKLIIKEERGGLGPAVKAVEDGKDKNGNQLYSIGYGHQIQLPEEQYLREETINEKEALELLRKDVESIRMDMNRVIKVPLNKNQQLALLSLRYNIGPAFNKSSLLRILNTGDYLGASMRFAEWRLSEGKINKGLVARRERERQLFIKPV